MLWVFLFIVAFNASLFWSVHRFVRALRWRIAIWLAVWLLLGITVALTVNLRGELWNTIFGLATFCAVTLPTVLFFYVVIAWQAAKVDAEVALFEELCALLGAVKRLENKNVAAASCSLTATYKGGDLFFSHYPRSVNRSVYYYTEIAVSLSEDALVNREDFRAQIVDPDEQPASVGGSNTLDEYQIRPLLVDVQGAGVQAWQHIAFDGGVREKLLNYRLFGEMRVVGGWLYFTPTRWHITKENMERARALVEWLRWLGDLRGQSGGLEMWKF